MTYQLIPLYTIGAIFSLYTLKSLVVYLWDQSTRASAGELSDYLKNITPTETPFMRSLTKDKDVH